MMCYKPTLKVYRMVYSYISTLCTVSPANVWGIAHGLIIRRVFLVYGVNTHGGGGGWPQG